MVKQDCAQLFRGHQVERLAAQFKNLVLQPIYLLLHILRQVSQNRLVDGKTGQFHFGQDTVRGSSTW